MKKNINCPPLLGIAYTPSGKVVEFGIVEYIQDVLLPSALSTAESCDSAIKILTHINSLRGPSQVDKTISIDKPEHDLLVNLAKQQRQFTPENLLAVATYNRAIYLAKDSE